MRPPPTLLQPNSQTQETIEESTRGWGVHGIGAQEGHTTLPTSFHHTISPFTLSLCLCGPRWSLKFQQHNNSYKTTE